MTEPLLNRASYDDLVDSIGDDGARTVLGLFIDESATYLATIAAAVAQPADAALRDKARRAAHSFKSGAGQIGAAAIAVAAAAVEAAAPAGGDAFMQSAETLRACTAETIAVLRPLLAP
ncbi:MAG: Hpt domain-containing protein [Alphaproteobacteria bacterium]|nr:Hpt domain-containing protein [Alphaproteobacteria bacterium]